MSGGSYRQSHLGRGADYDAALESDEDLVCLSKLERHALRNFILNHFSVGGFDYLDFACGTGRVLSVFAPLAATATGVDVSESMLRVAQGKRGTYGLIKLDLTEHPLAPIQRVDLVTAFRFFPNAEHGLRIQVADALSGIVKPGGFLVFNNHHHPYSLFAWIRRIINRPIAEVWDSKPFEVQLRNYGFVAVERIGIGFVPFGRRFRPLAFLTTRLEEHLLRVRFFAGLARYQIIVCQRVMGSQPGQGNQ